MGSQGDAGQFRTPRHIIDMIVNIVDPKKTDGILDIIVQKLIQFNYPKKCYV
jgi:type I restriction-modification system DNA methylase subunit